MSDEKPKLAADSWCPVVVAHRGCWLWDFPENSHSAFIRAAELEFPSECDVQQTRDGQPIVIHDDLLDRTSTGRGLVSSFTADELQRLQLKCMGDVVAQPPPILRDVSRLVSLVEIKPPDARQLVAKVIDIMNGRDAWLLQSFDPRNVQHALDLDPSTPVALLVDRVDGFEPALRNHWNVNVDHQLLDDRSVGMLQDHGLRIGAWTVNTEAEIRRILPYRPDVIISDQPALVREFIEHSGFRMGELS